LFRARNKNSEEKILSLLTQLHWDVVHGQDHWPVTDLGFYHRVCHKKISYAIR